MVKIAREKNGIRHFAVAVAGKGNVTEWTGDEDSAGVFTDEVAATVAKYHDGRINAGKIFFGNEKGKQARPSVEGPVQPPPAPKLSAEEKELAGYLEQPEGTPPAETAKIALAEIKQLEEEIKALKGGSPKLREENAAMAARIHKLVAELAEAKRQAGEQQTGESTRPTVGPQGGTGTPPKP